MAKIFYTRVVDNATGKPIKGASVVFAAVLPNQPELVGGKTNSNGEVLSPISWKIPARNYTLTVTAPGYQAIAEVQQVLGLFNVHHTVELTQKVVTLATPLTYPVAVGVGQSPDLVVDLPFGDPFDGVLVTVTGKYNSTSLSPIPLTGPVVVPMNHRLMVAPPQRQTLVPYPELIKLAPELVETYTIDVTVKLGSVSWHLGTITTTAVLVELADLTTRFAVMPWVTPWPGTVLTERHGYAEVLVALPRVDGGKGHFLYQTSHNFIDGPVIEQNILLINQPELAPAYQLYRIRVPSYEEPYCRLLIDSQPGNTPPLWIMYRTTH